MTKQPEKLFETGNKHADAFAARDVTLPILTTNFARIKRLPPGYVAVSIARKSPHWFFGRKELQLAPTVEMLKMTVGAYDEHFDAILAALDPQEILGELRGGVALLCWESPGVRCHRRRVAEWLEDAGAAGITEHGFDRDTVLPYHAMPEKPIKPAKKSKA